VAQQVEQTLAVLQVDHLTLEMFTPLAAAAEEVGITDLHLREHSEMAAEVEQLALEHLEQLKLLLLE
jgi:hypothetical protein